MKALSDTYIKSLIQSRQTPTIVDPIGGFIPQANCKSFLAHIGELFRMACASGSASAINIAFKTGAKELHVFVKWEAEGKAHFSVLEGASWTTNTGTAVAVTNVKRSSTVETDILEDKTASPDFTATQKYLQTVTSPTGTELSGLTEYCFSAIPFGGGESQMVEEVILKPDTVYVFLLTSDASAQGLDMGLNFFGVTP